MFSRSAIHALAIVLGVPLVAAQNAGSQAPELVVVRSGDASLRALNQTLAFIDATLKTGK